MGPFDSWLLQRFLVSFASASASRWVFLLFLFFLFSQSNPVDLPPAHQLHLHWLAIRSRHWHLRASVCAEADVYSTTQGCGLMHYTGITFFYCIGWALKRGSARGLSLLLLIHFTRRMRKDAQLIFPVQRCFLTEMTQRIFGSFNLPANWTPGPLSSSYKTNAGL